MRAWQTRRHLSTDSEMDEAIARLEGERRQRSEALAVAVAAMRRAAHQVTHARLVRWNASATKQWEAQLEVVQKHGLPTSRPNGSPMTMVKQIRRTWLGNVVGLMLPLWTYGWSAFTHGLMLPVLWATAVVADVAGKTASLRSAPVTRASLMNEELRPPSESANEMRRNLESARAGGSWDAVADTAHEMDAIHSHLASGDRALLRRARTGKRFVLIAFAGAFIAQAVAFGGAWHSVLPRQVVVLFAVAAPVAVIFAVSRWLTSVSYEEAVARPPYPQRASFDGLWSSLNYEWILSDVQDATLTSSGVLREHSTEAMLRVRGYATALRKLYRAEQAVAAVEAEIATLIQERRELSLPGRYNFEIILGGQSPGSETPVGASSMTAPS